MFFSTFFLNFWYSSFDIFGICGDIFGVSIEYTISLILLSTDIVASFKVFIFGFRFISSPFFLIHLTLDSIIFDHIGFGNIIGLDVFIYGKVIVVVVFGQVISVSMGR